GATVTTGLVSVVRSTIPDEIRYLGFAGALTYPIALGAFLVSVMVMDHFSMRYLAVLTLMLPFAALPVAHRLGAKRFAVWMSPHLMAWAIDGWVGYGPFVRGPIPIRETPELHDDYVVYDLLRSRGIRYAEADYWASYRLTFLFGEQIVVVPTHPSEDRYRRYRMAFEAAPLFAYIFDPGRSRENLADVERTLLAGHSAVAKTRPGGHT